MWQRKQTLFLGLAILCLLMMIFFPVWRAQNEQTIWSLFPLHFTVKEGEQAVTTYFPYSLSAILAIAAITVAWIEITKFENRLLQMKLGALNALLMAGSMGSAVYFATQLMKANQIAGEYGFAIWLPGIAMVCNMIANRFIRRDEKLVRDSERLR